MIDPRYEIFKRSEKCHIVDIVALDGFYKHEELVDQVLDLNNKIRLQFFYARLL